MRPPPQSRSYFYKPNKKNVNDELIKSDVEERGCENIGFVNMSDNKYVESQICMLQKDHKNRAFKRVYVAICTLADIAPQSKSWIRLLNKIQYYF